MCGGVCVCAMYGCYMPATRSNGTQCARISSHLPVSYNANQNTNDTPPHNYYTLYLNTPRASNPLHHVHIQYIQY